MPRGADLVLGDRDAATDAYCRHDVGSARLAWREREAKNHRQQGRRTVEVVDRQSIAFETDTQTRQKGEALKPRGGPHHRSPPS